MANSITRKDIITDDAIKWGEEYAKTVNEAININKSFVDSIVALNAENVKLRRAENNTEYLKQKNEAKLATDKLTLSIKEQQALELSLEKIKQEKLRTEKLELDALRKAETAKIRNNKLSLDERILLSETNKKLKEEARERLGLNTAYERLNKARLNAQKTLANLLSAEKQNNAEIVKAQFEFDKLDARVKAVDAATKNYSKNIGNYASAFKGLNQTAKDLLATFGVVTGLALFGTVVKDIFSVLKDFDRQLIAVGKTTNIEGQSLKNFGTEVVSLGDELDGISVEGLLKSAEVAGTLGVKGTDNILKFSTAIEKLKLTSDIISEEQVQNFAQFISVSQDSFENADRLASVMTVLGNNFATTEAKVLSNATEIQKGVSIYNASAEGILGLGAATSSLGSEAETSRSAIQSTFRVIDQAVSSGKNLEQVLKLTGLTQAQLSKQFNKDATGVFVKFVGGLSKAKDEGKNLNNILDSVEITEKRAVTVIGALAANYDTLTESVSLATLEYQENLALNKEVEAASQSISSILGDIKDKWDAYILSTDQANGSSAVIAKTLKFVRDNLKDIIDAFTKYGAVLLAYFGVMKLVNFVTSTFTALKVAAAAAELRFALATGIGRTSVLAQAAAVRAATVAQTGLNVAMTATPWGIILAALAAVIVAYKIFNDQLSETEIRVNAVRNAQKKLRDEEEVYSAERDKNRERDFKAIEDDIALRKAKGENDKRLTNDEIKRKKEVVKAQLEVFLDLKKSEVERTKIAIEESNKRVAQSQKEVDDINSYALKNPFGESNKTKQDRLINLKAENDAIRATQQANLEATKSEKEKLNKILQDLDKQAALNNAENIREETEKEKKEREAAYKKFLEAKKKALKEQYEADKKAANDAFKLSQFRLEKEIEINDLIIDNQKSSLHEKIEALESSNNLLAQKNKEALEFELKQLGTYNEDSGKFIRQLSDIEIESLIETGKTKQKLTDEQQLIYEKFQKEQTNNARIETEKRTKIIDSEVDAIQKITDAQIQLQENALNQEIVEENNRYKLELEQAEDNFNKIQLARDKHERKLLEIQNKYALEGTKIQIQASEKILADNDKKEENEKISSEKRAEIVANLKRYQREQSDLETGNYIHNLTTKVEREKEASDRIKELSENLAFSLKDLSSAVFDTKISNIEEEQQYWDDYYSQQLELAGNDTEQKKLIEEERDKKRKALEKERRKEEYKAAIAQKIFAAAQIGIDLAKTLSAIQLAAAQLDTISFGVAGTPYRALQTGLAIGTATAQAAIIAATPLPKYEKGTQGKPHKGGPAWVGEKRAEVVMEPGKAPYIVDMPTVLNLAKGTEVIPSIGEYESLKRASIMASIQMQGRKMDNAKSTLIYNDNYSKEIVQELKRNTEATKKNKGNIILNNKIDFGHQIWKMGNTKWN